MPDMSGWRVLKEAANHLLRALVTRYRLPEGMRYSTVAEREAFYREEFDLGAVRRWFRGRLEGVVFAVIIGRHTGIAPPEYQHEASTTIVIDEYSDLSDVRDQILEFRPEGVYYDRNVYAGDGSIIGQELAFDLDPENLLSEKELEERMERHQGLSFSLEEFEEVKRATLSLYDELYQFGEKRIVYSGRGFHIHVWVTTGGSRLIRLPHSLHGMVSRIVLPLERDEVEGFDPMRDGRCLPRFLGTTSASS
jgi:hypothetical protein